MWITNGNYIIVPAVWATGDYLNLKLDAEAKFLGLERKTAGRTIVVTGRFANVTLIVPLANKIELWYEVRVAFSSSLGNHAEIGLGAFSKDFIVNHDDDRLELTRRDPTNRRITIVV